MSSIWWFLSALVIGMAMGVLITVALEQNAAAKASRKRAARRAVLGLPDRDAPQQGAHGTARVHTAEYRERDYDHGIEM